MTLVTRTLQIILLISLLAGCAAPVTTAIPAATTGPTAALPPADSPPAAATTMAPATGTTASATLPPTDAAPPTETTAGPRYRDPNAPTAERVADLLAQMTLEEKLGQMAQVEKDSITPADITRLHIGSLLSGGGGAPQPNTPEAWAKMVDDFQARALQTRLGIPLIYGVDAVHGHNNLYGATIFPHNIGLGAANDPALVEQVARATAEEMVATGIRWNFAPVLAAPQDIRWGRTYEGYSEDPQIVQALGVAYQRGLQNPAGQPDLADPSAVLATPKHFIGDGATVWGSSTTQNYKLDQGDMQIDEATLRERFLPAYRAAIEAGAQSIMVSFSSWNGVKLHADQYLLTEVLKGELGFEGFLVSDWQAIDQIPGSYYSDVVTSINAGLDMIMIPYDYKTFLANLTRAVQAGDIPMERIDDAVGRILTVKFNLGLFEQPYSDPARRSAVGSDAHRALARQAVAQSLVLLQNEGQALPFSKQAGSVFVAGRAADDIGIQSGGWTIQWQGKAGDITPGTTILEAVQATVASPDTVRFDRSGRFENVTGSDGRPLVAEVGIVVVGEMPYAEGVGDKADLTLAPTDIAMIQRMRQRSQKLVVVLLSGRPLVITNQLPLADAWVAAWLPGTEGQGVADVLFGDQPFTGKLPFTWPRANDQLPINIFTIQQTNASPLFPLGHGLTE